jgi:hypothetical protein
MLDVFNTSQPTGCNIQTFYGNAPTSGAANGQRTWVKPRGVSHVYMLLIGAGGAANAGVAGGGTGAVTVWYGAAQNVPDSLVVVPGKNNINTTVSARVSNSGTTPTALLTANTASADTAGSATAANTFSNSGFYQSVSGQTGSSAPVTASATTFLGAGGVADVNPNIGNYGYKGDITVGESFFQLQPIIVGVGALVPLAGSFPGRNGAIGCGASAYGGSVGQGGPGMVLIASW